MRARGPPPRATFAGCLLGECAASAGHGHVVQARYTGIVPDTFKDNSETVIKGRFADDGVFAVEPGGVMAKCPSKYEASTAPRASGL